MSLDSNIEELQRLLGELHLRADGLFRQGALKAEVHEGLAGALAALNGTDGEPRPTSAALEHAGVETDPPQSCPPDRSDACQRLKRTLQARNRSNRAMITATDEMQYLLEVCRIVVEDCGHAMVWIGYAEQDEGRTVRPVAHSGFEEGYLETLSITWADSERGRGPTGTAIRRGKSCVCANLQQDPKFLPWREEALQRGYASSAVLPLMDEERAFGAISIYSRAPYAFSQAEIALLSDLAQDLAFGILSLRARQAQARSEELLLRSEERFRSIVELSPDAIFVNHDDRVAYINPAGLELFGAEKPGQILGRPPFDLFHPEYHPKMRERVAALYAGKSVPLTQGRIVRLDGTCRDVEVAASRHDVLEGRAIQVVLRDVTERRRAEEALSRALMETLQRAGETESVLAAMNDAVLVYDTDLNVVRANPGFIPTYGFDPTGLSIREIIARTRCQQADGLQLPLEQQPTPRALRGEAVLNQHLRITRFDGQERALETSATPLRVGGQIVGVVTVWHDITERKRAEQALKESEERFKMLYVSMNEGYYLAEVLYDDCGTPCDYSFLEVNPAFEQIIGRDREAIIGRRMSELIPNPSSPWMQAFTRVVLTGTPQDCNFHSEMLQRHFEAFAFRPAEGQVAVLVADITERKRAAEALQETTERLRLLSDVTSRLLASDDPQAVVEDLCREVMRHLHCECFFNFLADEPSGRLRLNACAGIPEEEAARIQWLDYGVAVCGCVAKLGQRIAAEDIQHSCDPRTDLVRSYGIQAYTCHPLLAGTHVIGTLSFGSKTRAAFSADETELMRQVTNKVAIAMQRMLTQRALEESEARFRVSFDNGAIPMALTALDGTLIRVNPAFCLFIGFTETELEGLFFSQFTHPDDLAVNRSGIDRVCRGEDPSFRMEKRYVRKDGSVVWGDMSTASVRDAFERPLYIVTHIMDITERRRAEEALRQSEMRFKTIASNTPDHILMQDCDLRYTFVVNPQLGLTEQDMLGKSDHDFLAKEDAENLTRIKRQVLESGEVVCLEAPILSPEGETHIFKGAYVPKYDEAGKIDGLIGYFTNVTDIRRTEKALREKEATVRAILDATQESVWLFDPDGLMLDGNKTALTRLGMSPQEVFGRHLHDILPPELAQSRWERLRECVKSLQLVEFEDERAGIHFRHSFYPVLDAEGRAGAITSYSRDITQSRQAQEVLRRYHEELEERVAERTDELRQASEYARSLIEASLDPLATIGPDGTITDVNEAMERMTGLSRTQLIGSEFAQHFTEPDKAREGFERVLRDGTVTDYPLGGRHRSGSTADVLYNATVYRKAGEVQGVFAAARDITRRKQAEEALRASEKRLAEAQRIAHLGGWEWDLHTGALIWSDEVFRIFGLSPSGQAPTFAEFLDRLPAEDRTLVTKATLDSIAQNTPLSLTYRILLPGGEIRHVFAQADAVPDDSGMPVRMVGTVMDITDRVRAEEEARMRQQQLVQADKMVSLGILVAGVAHEINNPNHSIMSNVTALAGVWEGARPILERFYGEFGDFVLGGYEYSECRDKLPDMFANALANSKRIEVIVTELRDFARHSPREHMAPVDLNSVVNSAIILMANLTKKCTDHFSAEFAPGLPPVLGNFQRIEQVVINLVQNACQALESRDKSVHVATSYDPQTRSVMIAVCDDGVGIPEENLKQLGTPFFTTKRGSEGMGLGLWISSNIAHEHGGSLVFSPRVGGGTRATLALPAGGHFVADTPMEHQS